MVLLYMSNYYDTDVVDSLTTISSKGSLQDFIHKSGKFASELLENFKEILLHSS